MGDICNSKTKYIIKRSDNIAFYSVACIDEKENIISVIEDISTDIRKTESFCEFLNKNKISPIHFYEVFEEYF